MAKKYYSNNSIGTQMVGVALLMLLTGFGVSVITEQGHRLQLAERRAAEAEAAVGRLNQELENRKASLAACNGSEDKMVMTGGLFNISPEDRNYLTMTGGLAGINLGLILAIAKTRVRKKEVR